MEVQHFSAQTYIAALQKLFDGPLQRQHHEQLLQLTSCIAARMGLSNMTMTMTMTMTTTMTHSVKDLQHEQSDTWHCGQE